MVCCNLEWCAVTFRADDLYSEDQDVGQCVWYGQCEDGWNAGKLVKTVFKNFCQLKRSFIS